MIKTMQKAKEVQQRRYDNGNCGTAKAVRRAVKRIQPSLGEYIKEMEALPTRWTDQKLRGE